MIKFFRHIRRTLINQNQMGKYFKYAIGEIFLVVIGILIALQINNWNEQRKINTQVEEMFYKTFRELEYNINRAQNLIAFYKPKDTLYYIVRNDTYDIEDPNQKRPCFPCILSAFESINISTEAANNLYTYNTRVTSELKTIIEDIDLFYKDYKVQLDDMDEEMEIMVDDYNSMLRDTKTWYSAFNNKKFAQYEKEIINYYISDPFFENWVAQYEQLAYYHRADAIAFISDAFKIYKRMSEYFDFKKSKALMVDTDKFKYFLGVYQGKMGNLTVSLKEDNYYLSLINGKRVQESQLYFDSDSTGYSRLGYIKFNSKTLRLSAGSRGKFEFSKEIE
ncbi:hypothetical protein [Winogradskyella vincentii]|uniref:Uncharacterized protein n=1 Tax=Winogradskyella vincentii TaxID=2877122 RepID=A0ABS7Y393_9FLAO|nr:hypothetical protein [Winogradskyella vincentii]